ncbi:hypothetical protein GCM10022223_03670 [Kineosporia mesophila]|uniref:Uncharacterized protein n=1 Tax=Kineosporia mesophila TaxID=566012 RepID=A0ABP6YWS0_9ACTN
MPTETPAAAATSFTLTELDNLSVPSPGSHHEMLIETPQHPERQNRSPHGHLDTTCAGHSPPRRR